MGMLHSRRVITKTRALQGIFTIGIRIPGNSNK